MDKVAHSTYRVAVVAPAVVCRPRTPFEVGVSAGRNAFVALASCIAAGLSKSDAFGNGPFQNFQHCGWTGKEITGLLTQIVQSIPKADPPRDLVESEVEAFMVSANKVIEAMEPGTAERAAPEPSLRDLMEELFELRSLVARREASRVAWGHAAAQESQDLVPPASVRELGSARSAHLRSAHLIVQAWEMLCGIPSEEIVRKSMEQGGILAALKTLPRPTRRAIIDHALRQIPKNSGMINDIETQCELDNLLKEC